MKKNRASEKKKRHRFGSMVLPRPTATPTAPTRATLLAPTPRAISPPGPSPTATPLPRQQPPPCTGFPLRDPPRVTLLTPHAIFPRAEPPLALSCA
jgi:hypothetical protein